MTGHHQAPAAAWAEWIEHDPDPRTAAELADCDDDELRRRFAHPLTFGTAGLRGPLRAGPDGMNLAVVLRTTWALAQVLARPRYGAAEVAEVVVGHDARHGSQDFARAAAEVLSAQGFMVTLLPGAVPTPVLAYAVRQRAAIAGVQITASHNPASDNGYKVYLEGGLQIIGPVDRDVEAAVARAPHADEIERRPVTPSGADTKQEYAARAAHVRRAHGSLRIALTPLHGVGGAVACDALSRAGLSDVHVVSEQFEPDPDFPTVRLPNPEEPGAVDALLELAAAVDAEIAIALDPDADRCAIGVPTPDGWRMLSGDETGWLLGDYILSQIQPSTGTESYLVASTVVSSRLLAAIAADHGARHAETLTGFKWLARADVDLPGTTLVYAYEEAIGHCVDPSAVRDKDGISAAVLACDLVVALREQGRTVLDALDALARRHGVHTTSAVGRQVSDAQQAQRLMGALRAAPPPEVAGLNTTVIDLARRDDRQRTDALIIEGHGDDTRVRVVVRPSGTEPKVKYYIEVRRGVGEDLDASRQAARHVRDQVAQAVLRW